ncbi:HAD-IIIC family phosphatase [Thermodesulfobacteriota bacterium]
MQKKTLGCFASIVPVPYDLKLTSSFSTVVKDIRKKLLFAHRNQEVPFEMIVSKTMPARSVTTNPIFQVAFTIEPDIEFKLNGMNISRIDIYRGAPQLDLACILREDKDKIIARYEYSKDLFKGRTIIKIAEHYKLLMTEAIENPDKKLSSLHAFKSAKALVEQINISKKESKKLTRSPKPSLNISIAATFTIELIEPIIRFWLDTLHISANLEFAAYNQVFQQLLDINGLFLKNNNGINLIFFRFDDWIPETERQADTFKPSPENLHKIEKIAEEFAKNLINAAKNVSAAFIVMICPSSPVLMSNPIYNKFNIKMETQLKNELSYISGVYPVTSSEILIKYPVQEYYEPMGETIGHIPYTEEFFISIGSLSSRLINNIHAKPFKVIIVDCDNTLWSGVVGEDGPLGVEIDEQKKWFQKFLVQQYESGMLICLCSKNVKADVDEVFRRNHDMVLKPEHITAAKINWNPKSQNVRQLAIDLNLGLDSFIFIDDSPVEIAEINAGCQGVFSIQMPDKKMDLRLFFEHIWAFDHLKVTTEDKQRTSFYQSDKKRESFLTDAGNFSKFINGLNLKIDIFDVNQERIPRASQMTQRVNQFNLTTIRRTESEIEKILLTDGMSCHGVNVSDKFGDYGFVGLIITKRKEKVLFVDTLLLSCRALGRGVEHRMISFIGKMAMEEDLEYIMLKYVATKKNIPIRDFLKSIATKYRKKTETSVSYKLPSNVAVCVEFDPKNLQSEDNSHKKSVTQKKIPTPSTSRDEDVDSILRFIAHNFNNVKKIKSALQRNQKSMNAAPLFNIDESSETVAKIVEVWQSILGVDYIGLNDNFFEIGGKSILIPLIVIQLKKSFDIDISIVDMLQFPTVAALSKHIDKLTPDIDTAVKLKQKAMKQKAMKQKKGLDLQRKRALNARRRRSRPTI